MNLDYRYLNRDGRWLDFTLHGVELHADGSLTLASVPAFVGDAPDLSKVPEPASGAGLAVDASGVIYYTLPGDNRVYSVDPCSGAVAPIPCLQLNAPLGLAIHRRRNALMVCDSGSRQVLIFDLDTWQPLESRGGFVLPVSIAVDDAGNSYVADIGAKAVRKFSPSGDPEVSFNAAVAAANLIQQPSAVAVAGGRLFVLDTSLLDVLVFDASGQPVPGQDVMWEELSRPMGLAVTADSIYVGDNAHRRVLRYVNSDGFVFAGEASGFEGPVSALAIGFKGEVLVNTGQPAAPLSLTPAAGFRKDGILWSGPFPAGPIKVLWHSFHADTDSPDGAGLQLFVFAGDKAPAVDPSSAYPFPAGWKASPEGTTGVYIGGDPSISLWVGARLTGDGSASPVLREIKARFNQKTYLPYLPGVYRDPSPAGDFLPRLLALFESFNAGTEDAIARLPELFDPESIPDAYVPWLATWMAVGIDQSWDIAKQRSAIAQAYPNFARRGTLEGLRQAVLFETGVSILIDEPVQSASWWVLPPAADPCAPQAAEGYDSDAGSALGFTTRLAGSAPQGAVIGSTTVMDQSRITAPEDFGTPLFDELAHRFSVMLQPGPGGADLSAAVAAVLDREKPAHTVYHLCAFEPRMRVGFQARVGIDTIVGLAVPTGRLDQTSWTDGVRLGGPDSPRIGVHSRIGDGLRL